MNIKFKRFFSFDSPKAIKATKYQYVNAINYMAPYDSAGVGNLCPDSSPLCRFLCLGLESGQASMRSEATNWTNNVVDSRKRKAQYFMGDRQAYMLEMLFHIACAYRTAKRKSKAKKRPIRLCVRPNGATDVAYEGLRVMVTPEYAERLSAISGLPVPAGAQTIFSAFPSIQFVDYTKSARRFKRQLPANYYLTFSRSETNEAQALELLGQGVNVAIVFKNEAPEQWNGFDVIDGDIHDLRHLDKRVAAGQAGFVVALTPKGNKAKSPKAAGFVI